MSTLDVQLLRRDHVVEIVEVGEFQDGGAAGLPTVSVIDGERKMHILSALDFPSYEWEKIKPGARLHLVTKEEVVSMKILSEDESLKIA